MSLKFRNVLGALLIFTIVRFYDYRCVFTLLLFFCLFGCRYVVFWGKGGFSRFSNHDNDLKNRHIQNWRGVEKYLVEGMLVRQVKSVKMHKPSVSNFLQHVTEKKNKKNAISRSVSENKQNKFFRLRFSYIFKSLFLNYRCEKFKCNIWRKKEGAGGERHLYSGWILFLEQLAECLFKSLTRVWPVFSFYTPPPRKYQKTNIF